MTDSNSSFNECDDAYLALSRSSALTYSDGVDEDTSIYSLSSLHSRTSHSQNEDTDPELPSASTILNLGNVDSDANNHSDTPSQYSNFHSESSSFTSITSAVGNPDGPFSDFSDSDSDTVEHNSNNSDPFSLDADLISRHSLDLVSSNTNTDSSDHYAHADSTHSETPSRESGVNSNDVFEDSVISAGRFDSSVSDIDLRSGISETEYSDNNGLFTPTLDLDVDSDLELRDSDPDQSDSDPDLSDSYLRSINSFTPSVNSATTDRDLDMYEGEYEPIDSDGDVQVMATPDTHNSDVESVSSDSERDADAQYSGEHLLASSQTTDGVIHTGIHEAPVLPGSHREDAEMVHYEYGYPAVSAASPSTQGHVSRTLIAWNTAQTANNRRSHVIAHSQPTPYSRVQGGCLQRRAIRGSSSPRQQNILVMSQAVGSAVAGSPNRCVTSAALNMSCPSLSQTPGMNCTSPAPGGSSLVQPPGGSSVAQAPGGSSMSQAPGGSSVSQAPGGSSVSQAPGGSSVSQAPGGSSVSQAPGGDDENEEEQCCPICFDNWTNSGDHRLVSLRCGHLFGQSCIEKWLKGPGVNKCPQCNNKAKPKDIRIIYAKSLKVTDTSEKDDALKQLEHEREARRQVELQAAETRMYLQVARDECRRLTAEVTRHKAQLQRYSVGPGSSTAGGSTSPGSSQSTAAKYTPDRTLKICELGDCRVMVYCPYMSTLCISQPSASPLFPGFGIKKVSVLDFRTCQYVSIHAKKIRDIAIGQEENILLSAAMDKTVKMTSLASNAVIQTYTLPVPVWSCAWNKDDTRYFYAGMQNGTVHVFDTRNTAEHILALNTQGSRSPVVSLQYLGKNAQASFSASGLIVGQLDRTTLFEKSTDDYKLHLLPLEANLTSLSVDDGSRHLLATYRPTQRQPSVRHMLYHLTSDSIDQLCTCSSLHTVYGGSTMKLLARSRLMPHPAGVGGLLIAGDESSRCVHIWDASSGQLNQKILMHAPVIDVCNIRHNNMHHLVALTDKQISVLKWSS